METTLGKPHEQLSGFAMTEEQNKLAEELWALANAIAAGELAPSPSDDLFGLRLTKALMAASDALREPATEAVLEEPCRYCNAQGNDPCAYPEGCKRLDNLVLRMLNTAIHSDIKHPPAGSLLREAVRAIRKLALKGKGASQGASSIAASQVKNDVPGLSSDSNSSLPVGAAPTIDQVIASMELSVAADGAIIYDWSPLEKRARELEAAVAAPEPSGEFVRVPREPTPEMIQAMEDRQIEGATYIAENSIQYALWREVWKAALAASPPMSRRDEDAKR